MEMGVRTISMSRLRVTLLIVPQLVQMDTQQLGFGSRGKAWSQMRQLSITGRVSVLVVSSLLTHQWTLSKKSSSSTKRSRRACPDLHRPLVSSDAPTMRALLLDLVAWTWILAMPYVVLERSNASATSALHLLVACRRQLATPSVVDLSFFELS